MRNPKETTRRRKRAHQRLRQRVIGTAQQPRLAVHKSLKYVYAQVIDDATGRTIAQANSQEPAVRGCRKPRARYSSYACFSVATTAGSASVLVSPSARPSAMSRSRRRMILPLRVFGSSAA